MIQKLRQLARIRRSRCIFQFAGRVERNTCFGCIGDYETHFRLLGQFHELFKLTVRIQCTADYVNHGQAVHRFPFVQALQIDVIETILRVQHVNHSFFDGLNHYYTAVEISFFVHVVDNPVNKRTKEITFAKLNNSFRTDRFLCGLFV